MGEPRIWTAEEAEALRKAATPGPYIAGAQQFRPCVYPTTGGGVDVPIADDVEDHATARLFAAAPDLAASVAHHARRADAAEAAELATENARYDAEVKHKEEITRLLDIIAGVEMVEVPCDDGTNDHMCPFCGRVKWNIHWPDRWKYHAGGCAWVAAQEVNRD